MLQYCRIATRKRYVMVTSYSTIKYNPVDVYVLYGGIRRVLLHDNIRQVEMQVERDGGTESATMWVCDEVEFVTSDSKHTKEYVESHFDEVWVLAETQSTSIEKRLEEVESIVSTLVNVTMTSLLKE